MSQTFMKKHWDYCKACDAREKIKSFEDSLERTQKFGRLCGEALVQLATIKIK